MRSGPLRMTSAKSSWLDERKAEDAFVEGARPREIAHGQKTHGRGVRQHPDNPSSRGASGGVALCAVRPVKTGRSHPDQAPPCPQSASPRSSCPTAAARASGSTGRRPSARTPGTACATISRASSSRCPSGRRRSWSSPRIGRRTSPPSASTRSRACSTTITAFPPHTYQLKYPAPGDPELAAEVKRLIEAAGLPVATDGERGFDHGVFVPFLIVDPKAEIPVVMLSLRKDLDPAFHIRLGKALEPLRDQGVAIVGSGMSFHDLRHFRDGDTTRVGRLRRLARRDGESAATRSARRGLRNGTRRRRRARAIRARSTCCR